jgi:hypothetical protein
MKNKFSIAMTIAVILTMVFTSFAMADGTPTITSDNFNYAAGETVNLFGVGWQAGEAVHIFVNDNDGQTWSYSADVVAANDGTFTNTFQLPSWFVATYYVTATGATSGTVATTFTDAAANNLNFETSGLPSGVSITITGAITNNGGNPGSINVTFISPGPSGNTGTKASTVFTYSGFPASVTASGQNCTLNSTLPASGSTTGGAGGTTTVTATYNCVAAVQNQVINVTQAAPATAVYGSSFNVAAIGGGSGNPVVITTTGACTGSGSNSATIAMTNGTGACNVYYNQAGNSSYNPASQVTNSTTAQKAEATINVIGYSVTYNGASNTANGTATGVLSEDLSSLLDLSGTSHTNAGTYTDDPWSFAGNSDYNSASGVVNDVIGQASSTVTVSCPANVVYNGSAQTPCTATASGVGMTDVDVTASLVYADNTNAGSATANASWAGDTNHFGNTGSGGFEIAKAPSTVTVSCPANVVYNGSAQTPCTATASGVGMTDVDVTASLVYADNTNAGSATANASWAGDTNHFGNTGSGGFTINKANAICTVTGYSVIFDNNNHTATGSCVGVLGENLTGLNLIATTHNLVGNYTDTWTFTDVTGNYNNTSGTVNDIILAWTLTGFYQPVDMNGVWNTVKNGSTVPFKFNVFAGSTELTNTSYINTLIATKVSCTGGAEDAIEQLSATGNTSLRYDTTAHQFIYNWQTPKLAGACYKVTIGTQDGSSLAAYFKLK